MTDFLIVALVLGALLTYLIVTHKLQFQALHDKLNQIIHRNTANDAAPSPPAQVTITGVGTNPAPLKPEPAAPGAPGDPGNFGYGRSSGQPAAPPADPAPPVPAGPPASDNLWPLPSGLWPIGTLEAGQSAKARYCVPEGWTGTITFAVSGLDTRGHTITIDGASFNSTPFASPDPRAAVGWHDIEVAAIGLGSGSANLWHDPR